MEDITFASKHHKKEYERNLQSLFPSPYIVSVRNENGNVRDVSVFDKEFYDAQITLNSGVPDVSYTELCMAFYKDVEIGMLLVRILNPEFPEDKEILNHMRFQFKRKDGRGNAAMVPLNLYDDPSVDPSRVLFKTVDFTMDILSSINFTLPPKAEIELHLFKKKHDIAAV